MTYILALETATEACSVALMIDGAISERFEIAPRQHAALVMPFAESLLAEAGLGLSQFDAVAFGRGPGSFTGLRIAAGLAQGMAFGAGLPVLPVSTLAAIAQGVTANQGAEKVVAALDARMQEVYWGAYRRGANGVVEAAGDEVVCLPAGVPLPDGAGWTGAGSGWDSYAGLLSARCGQQVSGVVADIHPRARDIARIAALAFERGEALPPEQAMPVYLRDNVAARPKPKV